MRKVKVFMLSIVLCTVSTFPLIAQGYPVLDVANLVQAIETLFATYDEITTMIEQVQNTYQQLNKQVEMMKKMDFKNIENTFKDMDVTSIEGILSLRNQIDDVIFYVNKNMNMINAVEDTLTKKMIRFGGKSYTFGGLFGFGKSSPGTTIFDLPKNMVDYIDETAEETMKGYEGKMTYKQKEALMRRHGMSPRNYAKIRLVEEQTSNLIRKLLTVGQDEYAAEILKDAAENQKAVDTIMQAAGESMVGQQQATTTALLNLATAITKLEIGLNNYASFAAKESVDNAYKAELEAQAREIRAMNRKNEMRKHLDFQTGF